MLFAQAKIQNFRNITDVKLEFSPHINIFLGRNGQGKTNILEALYLLNQGSSFRFGENHNFIQNGKNFSLLKTEMTNQDHHWSLEMQLQAHKKIHSLNQKKMTSNNIAKNFPVVIFSPESLQAIKGSAEQRRFLLDSLLMTTHPQATPIMGEFRRALRTRNRVLQNHARGIAGKGETEALLESINPSFLLLATQLCRLRIEALQFISPEINQAMSMISRGANVDITVDYVVSGEKLNENNEQKIFDAMSNRQKQLRSAELAAGTSLVGPHKHDIVFLYNQNDSRFFCSQGQQRALILSFKIAQIRYHRKLHQNEPVLMLDDVLSELDEEKKTALLEFLKEEQTQIFITTTDYDLTKDTSLMNQINRPAALFAVDTGQILERSQQ